MDNQQQVLFLQQQIPFNSGFYLMNPVQKSSSHGKTSGVLPQSSVSLGDAISFPVPKRVMFLPVIIPEKCTAGSDDLSGQVIEGKHFHSQPYHAKINQKTTYRDCGKCRKLCKIVPVLIMEIEILVQDITGDDTAAVRHRGCRDIPDLKKNRRTLTSF